MYQIVHLKPNEQFPPNTGFNHHVYFNELDAMRCITSLTRNPKYVDKGWYAESWPKAMGLVTPTPIVNGFGRNIYLVIPERANEWGEVCP